MEIEEINKINNVHIRIKQRNKKKYTTTVEGLEMDLDLDKILELIKKICNCNGSINNDQIIKLQGDLRQMITKFLIENDIVPKNNIIVHGP